MARFFDAELDAVRKSLEALIAVAIPQGGRGERLEYAPGTTFGWSTTFENETDFRFLACSSRNVITTDVAMISIGRMIIAGVNSLEQFEKQVSAVLAERAQAALRCWRFVIPFPVQPEVRLPATLQVRNTEFELTTWGAEDIQLDDRQMGRLRIHSQAAPGSGMCVLGVNANGATEPAAWATIEPDYDVLRGTIEFLNGFGRTSLSSPLPRALRQVPHATWMVAVSDADRELTPFTFLVHPDDREAPAKLKLTQDALERFHSFAKTVLLSEEPTETQEVILDCLRLHAQAIDRPEPWQAFLGLWQLAEAVTCSDQKQANNRRTARRLATMASGNIDEKRLYRILCEFGQLRNNAVHRGLHEAIGQEEVNFLKLCCDFALDWLVKSFDLIPTLLHFNSYFDNCERSEAELTAIIDGIGLARKSRTADDTSGA